MYILSNKPIHPTIKKELPPSTIPLFFCTHLDPLLQRQEGTVGSGMPRGSTVGAPNPSGLAACRDVLPSDLKPQTLPSGYD